MRILLTGADGQLGRELLPLLDGRGELLTTTLDGAGADRALDLADADGLTTLLHDYRPSLIFNAAAYTAVDKAESEPDLAQRVNGTAPEIMSAWAADAGSALVHFSTDYVFDGRKASPYLETDQVHPINRYGVTKLAGEQAVQASGCRYLILRTSWVYASHGQNFVLKMLELARTRDQLSVVSDQVGRPTWAANLARYALAAVDGGVLDDPQPETHLMHAADAGAYSWFEFSRLIFETAVSLGLLERMPEVREVGSDAFPSIAQRPASSVLGTGLLRRRLGLDPAPVKESVAACLGELLRHD
jgi:dTDP-4-dehydrorhamnose reductase